MLITAIESSVISLPFKMGGPYPLFAGQPWDHLDILVVKIETDDGLVGWGEAFGHTAIDAVAFFNAILKGQARQVAVEFVGPLVIRANKTTGIALRCLAKTNATVGAAVFNNAQAVVSAAVFRRDSVAHHDYLALAYVAEFVVASVRNFDLKTNVTPMRAVENLVQFLLVKLGIGVDPKRNPAGAGLVPTGRFGG